MANLRNRRGPGRHFNRFYRTICRQKVCVYCGVTATTVDHFVPLSVISILADHLEYIPGKVLVPCCGECNALAGKKIFPTIAAKRRYIQSRLRKRYRHILAIPSWTSGELAELGYAMHHFVRAGLDRKEWLLARLAWRNTSNSEPVKLADVRFRPAGVGKGSAAKPASNIGITGSAYKS